MLFHFSNFDVHCLSECSIKTLRIYWGTNVVSLNVTEKFHYPSSRRLNVTSSSLVRTFYNFLENRSFLDSN